MCGLPASHTFLTHCCARFPSYETRSSGYRPHTVLRSLAPSLQSLTGKRSLTYSIAPFMVELFTFEFLARYPRMSAPVLPVARQQLPTPAALNELARGKSGPHGRDFHPLCLLRLQQRSDQGSPHRHGLDSQSRMRIFRIARYSYVLIFLKRPLDRTLGLLRLSNSSPKRMENEFNRDYANEPPSL